MQIRKIKFRNLHSIRSEVEIDFMASPLSDAGLFAITGDTGAGKTTILDAITLAMYGKVCRNSRPEEALSHGAEEAFAECDFEAGGRLVRCQWRCWVPKSKKASPPKTERTVAEWDEEKQEFIIVAERKKKEVESLVEEVSGLDFVRFTRSVLLAQGDFAAFLKAIPKERSELLERITGTAIYSEFSKAAHDRHNLEKAKLAELVAKREAVQVLSKEALTELKTQLKEKEKEAKATKSELETTKNALQWLKQVTSLKEQHAKALGDLELLEIEKASFKEEETKLTLHKKSAPLHPTLARFDDKKTDIANYQSSIQKLAEVILDNEAKAKIDRLVFEEKNTALEILKKGQTAALRLFDEVVQLDGKIASLTAQIASIEKEQTLVLEKSEANNLQSNVQAERILAHQTIILENKKWLETHANWEGLTGDLPAISIHREQLRDLVKQQKRLEDEIRLANEQASKNRIEADKLAKLFEQEQSEMSLLLEDFQKTVPEQFSLNRLDLLEKIAREIEVLGVKHQHFAKLDDLNREYKSALSEHAALEERLELLRKTQDKLDREWLNAIEEYEDWEAILAYKRAIYQQQQLLVNYEKDRANLQDGKPCPLCGATHHPYLHDGIKPLVDVALNDLKNAEKTQKELQQKRQLLLRQNTEIHNQIQQLTAEKTGSLPKLEAHIFNLEQRLASLLPHFDGDEFSRSHGDWVNGKLGNFESQLVQLKATREKLADLNNRISKKETSIRALENHLKECRFAEQQHNSNAKLRQNSLAESNAKFAETTAILDKVLGKYGYRFAMETAANMFGELEAMESEYSSKRAGLTEQEKQLELAAQALQQLKEAAFEIKAKKQSLAVQLAELQNEYEHLSAQRRSIFGEKNPLEERESLLSNIEKGEHETAQAHAAALATNQQLVISKQELEGLQKQLEIAQNQLSALEKDLVAGMETAGFADLEILRLAVLPQEIALQLEKQQEQLRNRESTIHHAITSSKDALDLALSSPATDDTLQELMEKTQALESSQQMLLQEIGALNQRLKDNEARKAEGETILMEIEQQKLVYNRWAAVHDLIGAHDGSKFRRFAQGLTLQKLVQLANVHLNHLFGRYQINKRPGEDLELDIVDTFQADNVRSMMTLSGGESFLVSLSLALGLSDLAGRNANIRSLFIDEGFGTLDEQTLDLAISTLENLQASGKTIGIISHVKELKERIATQIRVMKKGGGVSLVEVV